MNRKLFFAILLSCIFIFSTHSNAQQGFTSGSMQIIISGNTPVLSEITGPMSFKETISQNIILSNLTPGEYFVKVHPPRIDGVHFIINQRITVRPAQRTIVNAINNRASVKYVFDENSHEIYTNVPRPGIEQGNPPRRPNDFPQMNENEFIRFHNAVKQAPFDKDKLKIVSAAGDYAIFNTEQARQTIKLFAFDNGKLDCIKIMADKVYDKQNLYLLTEEFSFSGTKNQYLDFLKAQTQSNNNRRRN